MRTKFRTKAFAFFLALLPYSSTFAIDFDLDGYDDFILVDVGNKSRLEWYAIDINDSVRRPLGQFGKAGDHLAVGDWSGNSVTSKALVRRKDNGEFEWSLQLPTGQRNLSFGSDPDMVISGFDYDKNGAIDPVVVSNATKKLFWKVIANPGLGSTYAQHLNFGAKREIPFYADTTGTGDRIATAKVGNNGTLTLRYMNLVTGKVNVTNVSNYKTKLSKVLPVSLPNGKDVLFAIYKKGKSITANLIKGNKKTKSIKVSGDEIVVGNYLGNGSEVLVVRKNAGKAIFIDAKGKKTTLNIDLKGVLADEVNINSFKVTGSNSGGGTNNPSATPSPPEPPTGGSGSTTTCSGTPSSADHLLYKPVSDTNGNAVLVFDSKYGREFLSVKIELKDGTFAEAWWKGLELWGNPDAFGPRQHWRLNVRASQVKDGARIIVNDTTQQCTFVLPGSSNKRWE